MSIGEMSISDFSDSVYQGWCCVYVCVCVSGGGVEAGDLMGRGCQSRQCLLVCLRSHVYAEFN